MFDLPKKMVGLYVKPETTDKEMAKLTKSPVNGLKIKLQSLIENKLLKKVCF